MSFNPPPPPPHSTLGALVASHHNKGNKNDTKGAVTSYVSPQKQIPDYLLRKK